MNITGEVNTVVADIGTETYKIGCSGTLYPTIYSSTIKDSNYDKPLLHSKITCPTKYLSLLTSSLSNNDPLILSINYEESNLIKKNLISHLIEKKYTTGILLVPSNIMDMFSYGKSSGVVVNMSGGSTSISTVIEGNVTHYFSKPIGGYDLTQKMKEYINDTDIQPRGYSNVVGGDVKDEYNNEYNNNEYNITHSNNKDSNITHSNTIHNSTTHTTHNNYKDNITVNTHNNIIIDNLKYNFMKDEILREIKEGVLEIRNDRSIDMYYELPSGKSIKIGDERYVIPEMLLKETDLINNIRCMIDKNDQDVRHVLYGNIMLSGMGVINGVSDRIVFELGKCYPPSKVKVWWEKKMFSTFFGCSVVGSVGIAKNMFITHADYDECGESVLERKNVMW